MEMRTGTVITCNPSGQPRQWNGKTLYDWHIQLDNGDAGEMSTTQPSNPEYAPGQRVTYMLDLSKPQYPKIRKPKQQATQYHQPAPAHQQAPAQQPPPQQQAPAPPPPAYPQPQAHPAPGGAAAGPMPAVSKDWQIIRESALKSAVQYHTADEVRKSPEDVCATATLFEAWIVRGQYVTPDDFDTKALPF